MSIARSFRLRNKRRSILSAFVAGFIGFCASTAAAQLQWDPSISAGANLGGTGVWNTTTGNWYNGASDVTWNNLNAIFGGTAGTVSIAAGGVTATGLEFNTAGYTIQNNTLNLGPAATIVANADATITSALGANANALTKSGTGIVSLSTASTRTGITAINDGRIRITNLTAIGTGNVTVNGTGVFEIDTVAGNLGQNVTLENGGTLQWTPNLQLTLPAGGKAINLTGTGGTIFVGGTGATGKVFINSGLLSSTVGSTLIKTGGGVLQLANPGTGNPGFNSDVQLDGGTIEFQHADSFGTTARTVTVNAAGDFANSGVLNRNNFVMNGGIMSSNNVASNVTGNVNFANNSTVALRQFNATTTSSSLTISGNLTGSAQMNVTAPNTTGAPTLYLSGNNSGYTGEIVINTNATVSINGSQAFSGGPGSQYTINGGALQIRTANLTGPTVGVDGISGNYYNFGSAEGTTIGIITGVNGTLSNKFAVDQLYLSPRVFNRTDSIINIPNSGSGTHTIVPVVGGDYAAFNTNSSNNGGLWKGLLNITTAGTYTFTSASDDNSAIWIDGQLVVNSDTTGGKGISDITGTISLTPGYHSIVAKFAQGGGGSAMQVSYSGADTGNVKTFIGSTPGTLKTGSLAPLDLTPNNIVMTGNSTLDISTDTTLNAYTLGSITLSIASPTVSTHTFTGDTTLAGNPTFAPTSGGLTFAGKITGSGNVTVAGPYLTTYSGTGNDYVGSTTITGGTLALNGVGGTTIPGDLIINAPNANGAVSNVKLLANSQIADTSTVTMTAGFLDVGNFNDTVANLNMTGGAIIGTGGVLTVSNAPTISGGFLTAGLGGNYTLDKTGTDTLTLAGTSTYTGLTQVSSGVLFARATNALGAGGAGNETTVLSGAVLRTGGANLSAENITINGDGISGNPNDGSLRNVAGNSTINNLTTGSNSTVRVDAGQLIINGTLNTSGGALTKTGNGTLTFASNQASIPAVTLSAGALGFSGTQSFGAATVPAGLAYQFNSDPGAGVTVTVNAGSSVIGNYGVNQTFLSRLTAGSNGSLLITSDNANNLDFSAGPNVTLGATGPVTYSGTITPNSSNYRLGGGTGTLHVRSTLSGSNTVEINGPVALPGVNTFTGNITINAGGSLLYTNNSSLGNNANVINLNGGTLSVVNNTDQTGVTGFAQFGQTIPLSGAARSINVQAGGGTLDLPSRQGGNGGNQLGMLGTNSITGTGTLTKTGLGGLYIFGANSFSGPFVAAPNSGRTGLRAGGALASVSSITLGTATELDVDNNNGLGQRQIAGAYVADRINNAAPITMTGGSILYTPRGTAGQITETFGNLTLNAAQNAISANANLGTGTFGAVLKFGTLTRQTGSTLRIAGNAGTFGAGAAASVDTPGAQNTQVQIAGLAAGLQGYASAFGVDLVQYDTPGASAALNRHGYSIAAYTNQGATAFTPVAATVYNLNAAGTATLNSGNSEMAGLRFGAGNSAQVLAFNAGTQLLAINSGAIIHDNNNQNRDIGTGTTRGIVTAGPLTGNSIARELFLHSTNGNLRVFSRITDNNGLPVSVVKDLDGQATLDAPNNDYTGGTYVNRGTLTTNGAGRLGAGPVFVRNSRLNIVAADSILSGAANGGYTVADQGEIFLGNNILAYSGNWDRFTIGTGSTIIGTNNGAVAGGQSLNSLSRVSSLTSGGQIVLDPGAVVGHQTWLSGDNTSGVNTIQNLGTNADLMFGVYATLANVNATLSIGAGTPWAGISTGRTSNTLSSGRIFANSDFTLQGLVRDGGQAALTLGAYNDVGSLNWINNGNTNIRANIVGQVIIGDDLSPAIPSSIQFVVTPGAIFQPNSSKATGDAPILVQNGGILDPGNFIAIGAAANQNVNPDNTSNGLQNLPYPVPSPVGALTVQAGGRFLINDASGIGSAPTNSFALQSDSILELGTANAFYGRGDYALNTSLPIDTTGLAKVNQFAYEPNVLVRITSDNIYGLTQFVPMTDATKTPTIQIAGGNRNLTNQNNPFIIPVTGTPTIAPENVTISNGTVLTNDTSDRQINEGRGILTLGNGAIIAPTSQTYLNIQESVNIPAGATVTIGSTRWIDGATNLGAVQFNGPNSNVIDPTASFNMLDGTQIAFGSNNVWPDTYPVNLPIAVTAFPATGALALQPGNGNSLLLNVANFAEVTGQLTGNGAIIANGGGMFIGVNSATNFTSNVVFKSTNGQNPNLWKIGAGTMNYTGTSDSIGQNWVAGGELRYTGTGSSQFAENRVVDGGTLVLDNASTALSNRLGGITKSVTPQGGTFQIIGNATTNVEERLSTIFNSASGNGPFVGNPGLTTIKLTPGAATTNLFVNIAENFQSAGNPLQRSGTIVINSSTVTNSPISVDTLGGISSNGRAPAATAGNNGLVQIVNPNFVAGSATFGALSGAILNSPGSRVAATRGDYLGDSNNDGVPEGFLTQDGVNLPSTNTSGQAIVTGLASTTGFLAGMPVTGTGIPAGTTILSVDGPTQITLSQNTTANATNVAVLSGGMRLLTTNEYSSTFRNNQNVGLSVKLSGTTNVSGDTRVSTITMTPGSTLNINGTLPNNATLGRVHLNGGGVFVEGPGTATINGAGVTTAIGGQRSFLQANGGASLFLHTNGDLNLNAAVFTDNAVVKTGTGTVNVGAGSFNAFRGSLQIDAGTVNLVGANNSMAVIRGQNGATSNNNLYLNGGTLQLAGNSQVVNTLNSASELAGSGGTVTSSAPANLTTLSGGRFGGTIAGQISLIKPANNTLLLTNNNSYTGSTTVNAGTLTLRDQGMLSGTSAVNVNNATLQFDNGYLNNVADRIPAATPINMRAGTINLTGAAGQVASQTINTLNLNEGLNVISGNAGGSGAAVINVGNLVRPAGSGAFLNFVPIYGFLGAAGNTTAIRNNIANINGNPLALNDGIVAGWAVVNGDHFATYLPATGIGAMSNTADGYANYDSGDLTTATATQNVNDGTARIIAASKTVNSYRYNGGIVNTLNSGVTLTIDTGGMLSNTNTTHGFSPAANAFNLGITSASGELDVFVNQGTTALNVPVTGVIDLVKSGPATLNIRPEGNYTFTSQNTATINTANTSGLVVGMPVSGTNIPAGTTISAINPGVSFTLSNAPTAAITAIAPVFGNSYTGKTIVSGGTLNLNQGASGAGYRAITGDLVVNAATVTELNVAGQINPSSNITLSGGARLNMVNLAGVTETINSLTFLDGSSGTTNSGLDRTGTQPTSTVNIAAPTAITATNTNPSTAWPFIGGNTGIIGFTAPGGVSGGSTLNINSPVSIDNQAVGLAFAARIGNVPTGVPEGGLIKDGSGQLVLRPDQNPTFAAVTTVSGSNTLTTVNTAGLVVGQQVTGTGIPNGSYVTSITPGVSFNINQNATAAGSVTVTGQLINQFGNPATLTDVFNIKNGVVRADSSGALGTNFANTVVQNGAVLLGSNNANQVFSGSVTLKPGATLGATIQNYTLGAATFNSAAQSVLNIPTGAGSAKIAAYDYFVPSTDARNITINSKLTGSGALDISGQQLTQGAGGGGVIVFGNPILTGTGSSDYSGTITVRENAILQNQVALVAGFNTRTTGNALGTATINLAGGRLRLRDDASPTADFNNTTVTYGNNVTLSASSFLDANRQTSTTAVGNVINLGTLNVPSGSPVLNVDSPNFVNSTLYQIGFANLTGAGSLIKGGNGRLNINAIDPTYTGGLGLTGPIGLNQGPAYNATIYPNLVLPTTSNIASFDLGGFYITEASKALNVAGTFNVNSNAGDIASNSSNISGRLAVTNTTTLNVMSFVNNGLVGPAGGAATISATTGFSGSGSFVARGNQLNLDGGGIAGPIKVVGDNVVNANGTTHNLNNVEVQSGVLQIAPLGPATSSGNIQVLASPASVASGTSAPIDATSGTLRFNAAGTSVTHTGTITNSGTVHAQSGTVTVTGAISGTAPTYKPGLLEGYTTAPGGALPVTAARVANPGNFGIVMEPRMLQTNAVTQNALTGHTDNDTWIYTGYIKDDDGVFSLAQNIDDRAAVWINGVLVLNAANGGTSRVVSTAFQHGQSGVGTITANSNLASANGGAPSQNFGPGIALPGYGSGWHLIEIRMNNGIGGAGPIAGDGFGVNYGFGYKNGIAALNGADMIKPIDDGTGNLFVTPVGGKGILNVDSTATLSAGGFTLMANTNLGSGGSGTGTLRVTANAVLAGNDTDNLSVNAGATGQLNLAAATTTTVNLATTIPVGSTLAVGTVSGAGGNLVLPAASTLALDGSLSVTGAGVGTGPTVSVNVPQANVTGTGPVTATNGGVVNGTGYIPGTATVTNSGILGGTLTVAGLTSTTAGGILSPGNAGTVGTLSLNGGLTMTGAGLVFDLATPASSDKIDLGASLLDTTGGSNAFTFAGTPIAGTYTLIDYGTFTGSLGDFSPPVVSGFTATLSDDTGIGAIVLTLVAAGPSQWIGTGNWTAGANWSGTIPNSASAVANFLGLGTSTVTMDAPQTVNQLVFNNGSTATPSYTIGGASTLSLAGATPSITNTTGSNTITAPLNLANGTAINVTAGTLAISPTTANTVGTGVTATVNSMATLTLGGTANALNNTTNIVNSGTLSVTGTAQSVGNISSTGSTTVSGAGNSTTPSLTAKDIDQAALTINNGAYVRLAPGSGSTSVVTALTVGSGLTPTANLDISDNDVIVNNPSPAAAAANLTAVAAAVNTGFAGGDGIVTTTFSSSLETVGFGLNNFLGNATYNGIAVNDDSLIIKYTYFGDSNLDGFVTDDDLGYFLAGYGTDVSANPWILGDYNHDGFTTDDDLGFFLAAYGSTPGLAGGGIQAIPEPSTLVLGSLAGLGLGALSLRRRRAK